MNSDDPPTRRPPTGDGRVRDHLANDRTFLAWLRTALGLIGLGFVLARMGLFLEQVASGRGTSSTPRGSREFLAMGVLFLILGMFCSVGAGWLHRRTARGIDEGSYEPARGPIYALSAIASIGGLAIAGLVVWQLLIRR